MFTGPFNESRAGSGSSVIVICGRCEARISPWTADHPTGSRFRNHLSQCGLSTFSLTALPSAFRDQWFVKGLQIFLPDGRYRIRAIAIGIELWLIETHHVLPNRTPLLIWDVDGNPRSVQHGERLAHERLNDSHWLCRPGSIPIWVTNDPHPSTRSEFILECIHKPLSP